MNSKVINNTRSNLSSLFGGFVEVVTKKSYSKAVSTY